jgi:alkanesulfonate monooxygenase SsuD/methylene tetrahydromethanopterin reductase-like flavin-dependent oxidoreductase (luciferase family)
MTYRHPAVLANWAVTVDRISNGRPTLGRGAGWQQNEHEQYGLALGSPGGASTASPRDSPYSTAC